ncbi:uncharacterized protein RSE6_00503 [Rhynchosporium secalis]|uniref:DUF21-domain-containing protein n=1 Tax=Rhynchosporium secalis TaxID=38038 RepID=A0A1E1LVI2_RHYSE|nr:uncharacterized protein RSE6_00503 [Rhynchosporium secalis]
MPSIAFGGTSNVALSEMKLLARDAVKELVKRPEVRDATSKFIYHFLNGALSVLLLILGGTFAGLTLAFMGQDQICLQVIAGSGTAKERQNARKVLNVLQRGRHWVLVSLLLGNVITNETLPIILDQDVKGGLFAIATSTVLIVIFGEIIPQSVCAKHGLSIGAFSSRYVIWLMYVLFPIAYPISKVLDRLLGQSYGTIFNREGLKTLVALHERLSFSPTDRLNREEVTVIATIIDMNAKPISSIMTPISKAFVLGFDTILNDMTRYNILTSGFGCIPIHLQDHPTSFVGVLSTRSLVALNFQEDVTVGQLPFELLHVVRPDISCQQLFRVFRDRSVHMALVTEKGTIHGEPLGIITARDVMDELIRDPVTFKEEEE